MPKPKSSEAKSGHHPRSRHAARYDLSALVRSSPRLGDFIRPSPAGDSTVDFADPSAVTALNQALLRHHYGISQWSLPPGALCPPIPSRADYLHHLADLLAEGSAGAPPRGPDLRVLDIGVGANAIYPLIGRAEYGWSFVGSDTDPAAIAWARQLVAANASVAGTIELRLQKTPSAIFRGIVSAQDRFDACLCNPPFHASAQEALAGTRRKVRNLGGNLTPQPGLNFGGRANELWCPGGEIGFVGRMIAESAERPSLCGWFTTLVSKRDSLPAIDRALRAVKPTDVRLIRMAHGQKQSRIVAWKFGS